MGCLFDLFTLPFKAFYWFAKIIWEIIELFSHRSPRRHRKHVIKRGHSASRTIRETQRTSDTDAQALDRISSIIKECMTIAYANGPTPETKLEALRTAIKAVHKMRGYTPKKDLPQVDELEKKIQSQYDELLLGTRS